MHLEDVLEIIFSSPWAPDTLELGLVVLSVHLERSTKGRSRVSQSAGIGDHSSAWHKAGFTKDSARDGLYVLVSFW